jgi:hypothetical protein
MVVTVAVEARKEVRIRTFARHKTHSNIHPGDSGGYGGGNQGGNT